MSCTIFLMRESDKSLVRVDEYEDWSDVEYLWTDGNYACDCNRHLHFTGFDGTCHPCGDGAYLIFSVIDDSGELVFSGEV